MIEKGKRMHRLFAVAVLACLSLAGPAAGRGARPNVKAGISRTASERNLKRAQELLRARVAESLRRREALAGQIDRVTAESRAKLEPVLQRQRGLDGLNGELKQFDAAVRRTLGLTDPKERRAAGEALVKQFSDLSGRAQPLFTTTWRASGVDDRALDRALLRLLTPTSTLRFQRRGPWFYFGEPGEEEAPPPPPQTAFCFEPPYPLQQTDEERSGAATTADAEAKPETGTIELSAYSYLAGGAEASAAVGVEVTVPDGFSRLRVRAVYDRYQSIGGLAMLGACGSAVGHYTEILGPAERHSAAETSSGWAAGLWSYDDTESGSHTRTVTFNIPDDGGEYSIFCGSYASSWAAAGGLGDGFVFDEVTEICVDALE